MKFNIKLDLDSIKDLDLPKNVVEFLESSNAGSPKIREFKINDIEYVFNNVLNFNKDAEYENARNVNMNLKDVLNEHEIAFGRDGFGNFYLLDLDSMNVRFYDRDKNAKIDLMSFNDFIKLLGEK